MDSVFQNGNAWEELEDEIVSTAVLYSTAHSVHMSMEEQEQKTLTGKPTPTSPALLVERDTALAADPAPGELWSYSPADKDRLSEEVWRVSDNDTFVSRILRVITRDGNSKNFEEITGLDGLTFGVTDFAGSGVYSFFKDFYNYYPKDMQRLFGENARHLIDKGWIRANNPKRRNVGLIRFRWLREGLAQLLGERRYHGFQLAHFVHGKVRPALAHFTTQRFTREFSLAAMICIANSLGRGKFAQAYLPPALAAATGSNPAEREDSAVEHMLRHYTAEDTQSATRLLLERGFGYEKGALPSENQLGHPGRRLLTLFLKFPFAKANPFSRLGTFALAADERFSDDPVTA